MNPRRFTNPRSAGEQRGPTRKTRGWDRLIAAGVAGNGSWRDNPRSPAAKVLVRAFDRVHELPTRGPHRRTARRHKPVSGQRAMHLYAIVAGDLPYVKIGKSSDVRQRLDDMQTGCPLPLKAVRVWERQGHLEPVVHESFSPWRVRGEWFSLSSPVASFVGVDESAEHRHLTAPENLMARTLTERHKDLVVNAAISLAKSGIPTVPSSSIASKAGVSNALVAKVFAKYGIAPMQRRVNGKKTARGYIPQDILSLEAR